MQEITALIALNFEGHNVQPIFINEELHWIATEICKALGIANVSDALAKLDDDEKLLSLLPIAGQHRNVLCVNESGLYHLIFQSRKAEARRFRRWVTGEILPAIRKTGKYATPKQQRLLARTIPPKYEAYTAHNRYPITPEQAKALALRYVRHYWNRYGKAPTSAQLRGSFIKRFSKSQAQKTLEDLAREGKLEHFFTPHASLYGKFKPVE